MKKKFLTMLMAVLMVLAMIPVTAYADDYVAVTDITGAPAAAVAGVDLTLSAAVTPENASNKTILWSVNDAGTTGATIKDGKLSTTAAGTAVITATVANGATATTDYAKNITVTVSAHVPVTNITGVPTEAYATVPTALPYTVTPENASEKTVVWTVKAAGDTGAVITNGKLVAANTGTVTLTATIASGKNATDPYTQDFNLTVKAFVPATNITGVPSTATAGTALDLTSKVTPDNATVKTVTWTVFDAGKTEAVIKDGKLTAKSEGTVTVLATIAGGGVNGQDYTQKFNITVNKAAAQKLAKPTGLEWSTSVDGRALWDKVADSTEYSVQLYKDGKKVGDAVKTSRNRCDLDSLIAKNGKGSYSFTVTAIGDGKTHSDSDESKMSDSIKYNSTTSSNNGKIKGLEKSYARNEKISFSVVGDGMDNRRPQKNDTRWMPSNWKVDRDTNGKLSKSDDYSDSFKIADRGDYTLTVTLREQKYDGSDWVDTGDKSTVEKSFTVTRDKTDSSSNKNNNNNSSSSSSTSSDISVAKPVNNSKPATNSGSSASGSASNNGSNSKGNNGKDVNPNTGLVFFSFLAELMGK